MRYKYFGSGELATRLIKNFYDIRRGDVLYNSSDEENRIGIQINELNVNDADVTIITNTELKQRKISKEQLEKIIF